MVTYPIRIKRDMYLGKDKRRRSKSAKMNKFADVLENHINGLLLDQHQDTAIYMYGEIAAQTGISIDVVRELCFAIDCGSNGFTAYRRGISAHDALNGCPDKEA